MNNKWNIKPLAVAFALTGLVGLSIPQQAAAAIDTGDDTLEISGFVENATYFRNKVGLSKFRNTLQLEGTKLLGNLGAFSEVSINGTFRATYDGVYDLNSDEYGDGAGGAIALTPVIPATPAGFNVPPGGGIPLGNLTARGLDNSGLEVLGQRRHTVKGHGVELAVPVRPCDKDSRGCIGGYMDDSLNELRYSDFNDRWDFIRELYANATIDMESGTTFNLSVGKKQEVWGRTDLFRVLDIINPIDYSRNNIYDEFEDTRIPLWMATAEWQFGANNLLDDMNLQFVWVFDKFRPNKLGQSGTPNQILGAGELFRSLNLCWEEGCTTSVFAGAGPDDASIATNFGPGVLGIREAHMPEWSLANSQLGVKFEGVYKDVGFSLNAFYTRSQLPSLRAGIPSDNPFTGSVLTGGTYGDNIESQYYSHLISFDIHFPRVFLVGGSLDYYSEALDTAIRVEGAWTKGEEFADSTQERLFSESEVARWVIGADRNFFIRSINKNKAFLLSFQTFGQHILQHNRVQRAFGEAGMPDRENNYISTLLLQGWWKQDRLSFKVIQAYDWGAEAYVVSPSMDWLIDDNWRFQLGANIKFDRGPAEWADCTKCNPFDPFTASTAPIHAGGASGEAGLGGIEPLGRFIDGPIGTARNEDEIQMTIRYRF
ncbi:MAG: DUF1302 domain-containing protein [Cycloclasticus sp.]|uniref:Cox2 cytochrome oxidase subunit 2 n=2 Tax=Piscirickettsiaceae TaxID=135616 RepID=S5TZ04_9GAMM|nr:Cox2 cytochrome oxidase subunit 2 [Cycloclasticus zancles 78-ME]PHR51754.1 MAG: DUF1302 domain-containing protein [Cycloclasticus sp.]